MENINKEILDLIERNQKHMIQNFNEITELRKELRILKEKVEVIEFLRGREE